MLVQLSGIPGLLLRLSTLWALLTLLSASAVAGVIDTVDIDDDENPASIRVNFTIPLQYITHAPENYSDELHIEYRSISGNLFSLETEASDQQTVNASPNSKVPLLDTHYESVSSDRGVLTLRFSSKVQYKVYPGSDRRHVLIKVVKSERVDKHVAPPPLKQQPASPATGADKDNTSAHFAINLESSTERKRVPLLKNIPGRDRYVVYTVKFPIDDRVWHRLRLGFFPTHKKALKMLDTIRNQYPDAWIAYASSDEIRAALEQTRSLEKTRPEEHARITPDLPKASDERIEMLMEQARQEVATDNLSRAVQLYTKVLRYPENSRSPDALEYLGVIRERKGQLAHAVREYKRYLELYPEGEGAERVRQRLAGLTTASQKPRILGNKRKSGKESKPWDVYGGISQFYRRDESRTEFAGDFTTQSSISTDLDVTARKRSSAYDIQSRFTGSYLYDFLDDGSGDETSVSSMYIDMAQKKIGATARVGRQSRNSGGVLGRFDGLLAGYELTDWLTVNGVAGFPVFSTQDSLETHRYLYGVSADLGTFSDAWDFNTFIIEQQNDGILDRRAIGGEARYFDPTKSLLSFVDYDISYDELNTLILLGTWTLPGQTVINTSLDYRKNPILLTSNALQGQNLDNLGDLLNTLSEQQLRDLANDRSADSTTVTMGISRPITELFQVSGDVTVSDISGTDASGNINGIENIDAIPGTGKEYFYNLQLIGSNLITTGDISVLGLRYSNTSNSDISTATFNTRYPFRNDWRINPRFRVDYRDNSNNDSTQWIAAPSLRVDYRWRKRYRLEAEAGGEWSTQDLPDNNEDSSSYFFNLGYRADF